MFDRSLSADTSIIACSYGDRVVIDEPHGTVLSTLEVLIMNSTLSLFGHTDVDVILFDELARHWPSDLGYRAPGCLSG